MLPQPIDQTLEITLRIPTWLLLFLRFSWGLYICLKIRVWAYQATEPRNRFGLQTSFFQQALSWSDLENNQLEAGHFILVWFWPNENFEESQDFFPQQSILDTTAPNTPENKPGDLSEYHCISPPPLHLTPEPTDEESDRTYVEEEASRTSSAVQEETNQLLQRIQQGIDLDQWVFGNLIYHWLHQINETTPNCTSQSPLHGPKHIATISRRCPGRGRGARRGDSRKKRR